MTLRVVGAGLPRTATSSLKLALEQLLGGRCYHMLEVLKHRPDHIAVWHRAVKGELPNWDEFLADYIAAVDFPASAFWRELSEANPNAIVLLSVRENAEAWWRSADRTVFQVKVDLSGFQDMFLDLMGAHFTERFYDQQSAMAAYERYNDEVRSTIASDRLVEWRPGDGWTQICAALNLPVPDQPFPHVNTTAEFRSRTGLDAFPHLSSP